MVTRRRMPALTWAGRLDLRLVLFGVRVEEVRGRVLAALDLALEGVQTLDVLFLERTGRAARRAHVQVGGQLPPLLVLVHLGGRQSKKGEAQKAAHNCLVGINASLFFNLRYSTANSDGIQAYLGEAADLFDGHVESEKIERLPSHSGQVVHAHGFLLSEGQVSIHPHLPLRLWAELVQTSDLLVGDGGRARLLQDEW